MQDHELLHIPESMRREIQVILDEDNISLNDFMNIALAEKLSALRTRQYFEERAARGNVDKALSVLERIGNDDPPAPGDEITVSKD